MFLRILTGILALAGGLGAISASAQTHRAGALAPGPVLITLDGQYRFLNKLYYEGPARPADPKAVVVLNFMGVDCPPCRKELPLFLDAVRGNGTNRAAFRFFLVSTDPLSRKEDLRSFLKGVGVNPETEVLLDPYHKAADAFGVSSIPRTFVIAPDGRIVADLSGISEEYFARLTNGIQAAFGSP